MDGLKISAAIRTTHPNIDPAALKDVCNIPKCAQLGSAVWAKMQVVGEHDPEAVIRAIAGYADVLAAGKWKGIDTVADRVVKRYYRNHEPSTEAPQAEEGDNPEDEAGGSGQGQGEGQGQDQQDGEGSGQDHGDEEGDGGEGSGDPGDETQDGEGDGQTGAGSEGEGDDEEEEGQTGSMQDEESQGQDQQDGEDEGEAQDDTVPPEPEPESEFEFDDGWIPPKDFDLIVEAVRMGKNVALYGPAGCGKTDILMHVGMALGRPYYITTAPQMPYDLTGFVDAHGQYVETAFSVPFTKGGIAGIDEMDRAGPDALIAVNAPIANGTMFIPKLGQMNKHPDCIFMATLNTPGLGADLEYVTANQLDASTRDRFIWFEEGYDERIDMVVARNDKFLVDFAQDWRQACARAGVSNAIFSYRVLKDFKDLCENPKFGVRAAIDKTLLKGGVPKGTCMTIMQYFTRNNRYHKAFKTFVEDMQEDA